MDEERLTKDEKKELRKQERGEWEKKLESEAQKSRFKKFAWWLLGIAILAATVWILIITSNTTTPGTPVLTAPTITNYDISTDPNGTKVTLIEYADFQCPGCGHYYPIVKKLLHDEGGKIRYIYRMFPLPQIHKNAMISSQAGYAAYLQGKFFEMEDLLFTNQNLWANLDDAGARNTFNDYAKQLNLDLTKFQKDIDAQPTKNFINKEEDTGVNAGVNSTPTFFVNGKSITLPNTYEEFKSLAEKPMR